MQEVVDRAVAGRMPDRFLVARLEIMDVQHLAGAGCFGKAREQGLFFRQRHVLVLAPAIRLGLERLEAALVIGHVRAVHRAQRYAHRSRNRRLRHPALTQQHHLDALALRDRYLPPQRSFQPPHLGFAAFDHLLPRIRWRKRITPRGGKQPRLPVKNLDSSRYGGSIRPASDHNPGGKGRDMVSGKKTMKALVLRKHGGLDELEVVSDHPLPAAVPGHVVIRVRASSFNYHDVFTVRGMPGIKVPLPVVVGLDMAGEIAEVGACVAGWKVGERVLVNPLNKTKGLMGEMLDGGMAEYCLVAADQLVAMPAGVGFEEAAALPVAYGTAHRMLITHATVKAGERVLILGASGGVGTGCVILAKHLGAEVIACTSSPEKMHKLKELGADEVVNVKQVDFSKWAIERYGKPQRRSYEGGIDVVINFTGGDTWHPSLRCLKRA